MIRQSNLLSVTQTDLEAILGVHEGPHLDFKRDLPAAWDNSTKHEFLADVTAFANASGGDVVFGIAENDDGVATSICPQTPDGGIDGVVLRMQSILTDQAEPRMPGVQVHAVPVTVGAVTGHVVIIRVPQSWASPHRVKTNNHVFVRDGRRKRSLDMPELRALFLRTESQAQRIRDFISDRLAKVLVGETPTRLNPGPQLVVHVIPTQAALGLLQVDPRPYVSGAKRLPVLSRGLVSGVSLNLDGAYGTVPSSHSRSGNFGYSQLFRQGYFEGVWVLEARGEPDHPILPSIAYEEIVIKFVGQVRSELERLEVQTDVAVFLSLLQADRVVFAAPAWGSGYTPARFDRKTIQIPEALVPAEMSVGRGLRPAFDLMCQAVGLFGSANYDESGEWVAQSTR